MNKYTYIVWTQPSDPLVQDLISEDGVDVPTEETGRRQQLVSQMSALAGSRHRVALREGGFMCWSRTASLAEVPVQTEQEGVSPVLTAALRVPRGTAEPTSDFMVTEAIRVLRAAGHSAEEGKLSLMAHEMIRATRRGCLVPLPRTKADLGTAQ